LKSYVFPVVIEPDQDVWRAYVPELDVPELESKGAATWGYTKEEALKNIQEATQLVVEELLEDGESLPPSVSHSSVVSSH
jgi:predicted RNase H-like HicB family nuclease